MFGAHMVFSQPAIGLERQARRPRRAPRRRQSDRGRGGHRRAGHRLAPSGCAAPRGAGGLGASSTVRPAVRRWPWKAGDVFVVGAGNSGGQAALHLARYARQVTMLVRRDSLARSMSEYLIREIEAMPNIAVRLHTEITDGHGSDHLDALTVHDSLSDGTEQVPAAALFVLIGGEPHTQWLPALIQRETRLHPDRARRGAEAGVAARLCPPPAGASMPGVFAAGMPATARSSGLPPPSVTARRRCGSRRSTWLRGTGAPAGASRHPRR